MSAAAAAAADPGSPTAATADPTTPSSQEGVGGETGNHEGTPEVAGASVPVIRPALVYNKQGDVVEVLETVVQAVDAFRVPDDFVRKGAREQSYMYSLGVYCEKPGSKDHKFFCLASADCRRIKKSIPCRNGDRSQVERDFSACGLLLRPNRSRIDTYWVEMMMFLHVNYKNIPAFKDIPMIAAKDIRACLPARFAGGDEDLAAAEAAFDVVNNLANSDIGL